jgi:hypothetical protein
MAADLEVRYPTWHDLDGGRPIAAPLEQCAELLGVDLATVRELAAKVEPYLRADGTRPRAAGPCTRGRHAAGAGLLR